MKKLYLLMVTAILSLCCAFTASAADSVIEWETPGSVTIHLDNPSAAAEALPDGATSFTVPSTAKYAYVKAANGFIIGDCTYTNLKGEDKVLKPIGYSGPKYISISFYDSNNKGCTFKVNVSKIELDSEFTLELVNGASKIKSATLNGTEASILPLQIGKNTVKYSSALTKTLTIEATQEWKTVDGKNQRFVDMYSLTVNGEKITSLNNYFTVPLTPGCKVIVQPLEDAASVKNCTVTLSVPQDIAGCLSRIFNVNLYNWIWDGTGDTPATFTVEAGQKVRLSFNEDFNIESVNNGAIPFNAKDLTAEFTVEDNMTVDIAGAPKTYGTVDYTAWVVYPESVEIWEGRKVTPGKTGNKLDFTVGETNASDIVLPAVSDEGTEIYPAYTIPAGQAYKVTFSVSTKFEGYSVYLKEEEEGKYYEYQYRMGDKGSEKYVPPCDKLGYFINNKIDRSSKGYIYYAGETKNLNFRANSIYSIDKIEIKKEGEFNVFYFDPIYDTPIVANIYDITNNVSVTCDGVSIDANENGLYTFANLHNGSIININATGQPAPTSTLNVAYTNGATAAITCNNAAQSGATFKAVAGSIVKIVPSAGAAVSVNGAAVELTEGAYTFVVDGDVKSYNIAVDGPKQVADNYEFSPKASETVTSLESVIITFTGAKSVSINEGKDADECAFQMGQSWAAVKIAIEQEGVNSFKFTFEPAPVNDGTYTLEIPEGFFNVDGKSNPDITGSFTLKIPFSLDYNFEPSSDKVVKSEWGNTFGVMFNKGKVAKPVGSLADGLTVKMNDRVLTFGEDYMAMTGSENPDIPSSMVAFLILDQELGKVEMTLDAGAIDVSGTPNPEITHRWEVVESMSFATEVTPEAGLVESLATITVAFPDAESAGLFHEAYISLSEAGYVNDRYVNRPTSVEPVADAKYPTFDITFPVPTKTAAYDFELSDGAFTINGAFESSPYKVSYAYIAEQPQFTTNVNAENAVESITVTFPSADPTAVTINPEKGIDEVLFATADWMSYGVIESITKNANTSVPTFTIKFGQNSKFGNGSYTLDIPKGFFMIGEIEAPDFVETVEISSPVDVTPIGTDPVAENDIEASAEGRPFTIAFGDSYTVAISDNPGLTVMFNDTELVPGTDYEVGCEANFFTIFVSNPEYTNKSGKISISLTAGSLLISGAPSEAISYTWNIVQPKTFNWLVRAALNDLSEVTVVFEGAKSVDVFNLASVQLKNLDGSYAESAAYYTVTENADNVYVTFNFNGPKIDGTYQLYIGAGAMTIDGVYESPVIEQSLTLSDYSGVGNIAVDGQEEGMIYNLQGIAVGKDMNALPTGVYIRNGVKIYKR